MSSLPFTVYTDLEARVTKWRARLSTLVGGGALLFIHAFTFHEVLLHETSTT